MTSSRKGGGLVSGGIEEIEVVHAEPGLGFYVAELADLRLIEKLVSITRVMLGLQ